MSTERHTKIFCVCVYVCASVNNMLLSEPHSLNSTSLTLNK